MTCPAVRTQLLSYRMTPRHFYLILIGFNKGPIAVRSVLLPLPPRIKETASI